MTTIFFSKGTRHQSREKVGRQNELVAAVENQLLEEIGVDLVVALGDGVIPHVADGTGVHKAIWGCSQTVHGAVAMLSAVAACAVIFIETPALGLEPCRSIRSHDSELVVVGSLKGQRQTP